MSRNDITGDLQQTKIPSKDFLDDLKAKGKTKTVEERRKSRGSFKWCSEEKAFIPKHEWNRKYAKEAPPRGPMAIVKNFDPFISPVTNKVIRNEKEHRYDLDSSGCRVYEGRQQEQKEVDRYLAEQDKALEQSISDTVDETAWQIEHNYSRPSIEQNISWTFGEDDE